MKNLISFLLLSLFFTGYIYSQCTSNSEYGLYETNNSGFIESVSTLVSPGKYMTISNILENEYTFTAIHSVITDDYIVLTDSSDNILEQGVSPISYTFMPGDITGGIIRLHLFLDAACNTDDINLSVTILNETVAPTTCQLPENPGISYRSDTRIDFNWEAPSIGDTPSSYNWEAVPAGNAQGVGIVDSGNTIVTNASATGLTNNTFYVFYMRSNCGVNGNSDWYATPPLKTNLGPPPTNDFCNGAISVVQDINSDIDSSTIINGTLLNTAGTDILAEQCSGNSVDNARDDIWYSFLAQTTDVTITLDPLFNGILTLLSDCDASFILDCSDNNGSGVPRSEEITYNSLIVNQTYYVRVYYQGFATASPNFTLKIWSATATTDVDNDGFSNSVDCDDDDANIYPGADEIPNDGIDQDCDGNDLVIVPINDNLCDAIGLIIGNSTSGGTYTNVAATTQVSELSGACWANSDLATSTVWFSFVSPVSGELNITTDFNDGTLTNTQLSLYSASDCNDLVTLTPLFCNDDISGSNFLSLIEVTGLTSGNTYYLQVDGYADEQGTFDIGITETTLGTQDLGEVELFQFYPNPVNDILTIKSKNIIKHFSVFSILGERVDYKSLETSAIDIDLSKLASGLYLVKVVTDKGTKIIKVLKE